MQKMQYGIGRSKEAKGIPQVRLGSIYKIIIGGRFEHGVLLDIIDDDLVFLLSNGETMLYHDRQIELRRATYLTPEKKQLFREIYIKHRELIKAVELIEEMENRKIQLTEELKEARKKIKVTY